MQMYDDMCSGARVAAPRRLKFYLHDWIDENMFIKP